MPPDAGAPVNCEEARMSAEVYGWLCLIFGGDACTSLNLATAQLAQCPTASRAAPPVGARDDRPRLARGPRGWLAEPPLRVATATKSDAFRRGRPWHKRCFVT
jgi:hypothetical protein